MARNLKNGRISVSERNGENNNDLSAIIQRLESLEKRVSNLENHNKSKIEEIKFDKLNVVEKKLVDKIDSIGTQNLIIIALKIKPRQTKDDLESLLLKWGSKKTIHGWCGGGNFSTRLLDKGIVINDGKNSNNADCFSLTKIRGMKVADALFEKFNLL